MLQMQKYFADWQEINEKTLSHHTAMVKKRRVGRFLLDNNIASPAQITYLKVQEFLNELTPYYSPNTMSNWKHALSSFCTYLVKRNLLQIHPCRLVDLPRIIMVPPDYLTEAEVGRFIAAAELHGVSLPVKIAIGTGLRRQELGNLQWGDIDLARKMVRVINKTDFLIKNRKCRVIPIADWLHGNLANLAAAIHPEPGAYVVTTRNWKKTPGRRVAGRTLDAMLLPIKEIFPGRVITWRILRHTFASLLAQNGVSYYKIAIWLGNNPAICEKYYCNAGQQWDADINKLRAANGPGKLPCIL